GLGVEFQYESGREWVVEAAHEAVPQKLVLGTECRACELGRGAQVDAARRKQAVVARIEGQRGPNARGPAVIEQVREWQAPEQPERGPGHRDAAMCVLRVPHAT